ncbi:type I phosphodiesterase/nucleotide pyrophosphatase [Loa loa]|uniref:Type I phosphodiesterase/nucleotide pyrophosphatase n=1 Tax=Loa loa TaxID=7209 RepID=A0A1S0UDN6_LOALO|nr:type I phosphodiesterase/nucleotide pyrophosphatase [Loa loa]EJD73685.1 type I phosphodiesterase/nucleotide pyrophosphatase [Loa loa]
MAKCGTTAEYMYGTYPTKTFPNHYSIATGLYPESHGIVDNVIYDNRLKTEFINIRRTNDPQYFNGEPIWNVLERQNVTTACLFWPACDSMINGMQSTYNLKYNRSMPYRDRMDQIVAWLGMPTNLRPSLIMAYFDQPDFVSHFKDNEEISKELENIEHILDYLFKTLHSMELLNCVNVIILSDHGIQKINHRYYFDEMINSENILFADGVIGQMYFPNDTNSLTLQDKIMKTMEKLKCYNKEYYRVYDKRRIPKRYHFSKSNRIGDIILDAQLGTIFYENIAADYNKTHDHGYDFILEPMHAIFYAYGPNIAQGLVLKPFQNVELFNLMIALLNVNSNLSSPNNGTEGRLNSVLNGISVNKPQRSDLTSTIALIERINSNFSLSQLRQENDPAELITTSLSVKGTNDLQVNLHSDFLKGHFTNLEKITSDYAKLYNEVVVISGSIYDFDDNDFVADSSGLYLKRLLRHFTNLEKITSDYAKLYNEVVVISGSIYDFDDNDFVADSSGLYLKRNTTPSHIFRVIFRCKNSRWLNDELQCNNVKSLDVLSFILPNVPGDYNCLDSLSYLTANKASLRDIELLTGLEFLPTSWIPAAELYDDEFSITLRTMMPEYLWLEKEQKRFKNDMNSSRY